MKRLTHRYQPYRRLIQASILLLMIAIPFLNLLKIDVIQGTLCSIGALDMTFITCPIGAIQTFLTTRQVDLLLLLSASVLVVFAFVFGRVFCSWICVQHVFSEMGDKIRGVLGKNNDSKPDSLKRYQKGRKILLYFLGGALVAAFITGIPVICYICPIGAICRFFINGTYLHKIGGEIIIIAIILMMEISVARRGWCKYLCPVGALYGACSHSRSLKVRRNPTNCVGCGQCVEVCPMGEAPLQGQIGKTCTNCAICVDSCGTNALKLSFQKKLK
ncbi:MAG: 4Fe-4S binding protein [Candidatus Parabeggiatoa sp.]|nr:4Fe-4S binding protein [Candidatus Parabeggiatoa sp.]